MMLWSLAKGCGLSDPFVLRHMTQAQINLLVDGAERERTEQQQRQFTDKVLSGRAFEG